MIQSIIIFAMVERDVFPHINVDDFMRTEYVTKRFEVRENFLIYSQ